MGVQWEITNDHTQEILSEAEASLQRGLDAVGAVAATHAMEGCPVDTGRLRNSIAWASSSGSGGGSSPKGSPSKKTCYIGTNVEYAVYVETITRYNHTTGGPHFIKNAVANHADEYKAILEASMKS